MSIIGVEEREKRLSREEPIFEVIMAEIFLKLIIFSHRFKKLYEPQAEQMQNKQEIKTKNKQIYSYNTKSLKTKDKEKILNVCIN